MTKDEALDLALEALEFDGYMPEDLTHRSLHAKAITAIKQARSARVQDVSLIDEGKTAAPVQEPVAYLCENAVGHKYFRWKKPSSEFKPIALYTQPAAQRQWQSLTDEDIEQEFGFIDELLRDCVHRTEAKLKEINT
jgi:hypothetical protein